MDERRGGDQVIQRAKDGDTAAIAQLYEEHAPRLYRYFLPRVGGRSQQAEDLTEEVFVRVLERIERYEDRGLPFGAWLFRIAHNLLIDNQRRQPRQPLLTLEECEELRGGAERSLDQALDQHELARTMVYLTADQRSVIELRFIQGMSIIETAAAMGKTEESVKKLQARGLQALKRLMQGATPRTAHRPAQSPTYAYASA